MLYPKAHKYLLEINGLYETPEKTMAKMYQMYTANSSLKSPSMFFSDPVSFKKGLALMKFITKNELGDVVKSATKKNPNSQRNLDIFIFTPNYDAIDKWYEDVWAPARVVRIEQKRKEMEDAVARFNEAQNRNFTFQDYYGTSVEIALANTL